MALRTRLTELLGIRHPILNAPTAGTAGARLALAVQQAGGFGLIGGGFGNPEWLAQEFTLAEGHRVGCGFITWALAQKPQVLDQVLAYRPAAVMLSFGDPAPYAPAIHAAGALLVCQVQNIAQARAALAAGADVLVAQGTEAGGHGAARATMTLLPEVADLLARESSDTPLVAAGGIADGRGLAAALMLGADGVLMGTRFWASPECLVHANHQRAAVSRNGDQTVRDLSIDIAYGIDWPAEYTCRILRNGLANRWHDNEEGLRAQSAELRPAYFAAAADGRSDEVAVVVGEAIGLMHDIRPAAAIVEQVAAEAEALLRQRSTALLA